jgi:hypothetical protein
LHDENVLLGDSEGRIVNAFLHVGVIFEDDGGAFVLEEFFGCRGGLDDGAIGGEVAAENGGSSLGGERVGEGKDDLVVEDFRSVETFAKGLAEDGGSIEMEEMPDAIKERREASGIRKRSRPSSPLADLAHALFNSKEFIYVR